MDTKDISYLSVTSRQLKYWLLHSNIFWKHRGLASSKKIVRDKEKIHEVLPNKAEYMYLGIKAQRYGKEISRFYDNQFEKSIHCRIHARKLFYKGDTGMDWEH